MFYNALQIEALQQQECHYQTDNGSNHHLQQQLMWLAEQEAIRRKNDHELHDKLNDLSQMVNISLAPNTHNLLATIDNYVEEVLKGYLKEVSLNIILFSSIILVQYSNKRPIWVLQNDFLCLRREASAGIMFSGCPAVRPSSHYFLHFISITTEANSFILVPVIDLTKV